MVSVGYCGIVAANNEQPERSMRANMAKTFARKDGNSPVVRGNLELVRGDMPRPITPEQFLDREMQSICASCKIKRVTGTQGGYACRAVADIAQGLRPHALRVIGRMISSVIAANGPEDFTDRLTATLLEFAHRKAHQLGKVA